MIICLRFIHTKLVKDILNTGHILFLQQLQPLKFSDIVQFSTFLFIYKAKEGSLCDNYLIIFHCFSN